MKKGLHVGCGPIKILSTPNVEWTNIDIQSLFNPDICMDCLDIQDEFGDDSFDYIWTCHHLEHLKYPNETVEFLEQCYRVLKDNGILRIAVPDLEKVAEAYVEGSDLKFIYGDQGKFFYYKDTPAERFLYFMREWEHQICFDFDLLQDLLADAGFVIVGKRDPGVSNIQDFTYDRMISESLYVEAVK